MPIEVKFAEVVNINYNTNSIFVRTVENNFAHTYDNVYPYDVNDFKLPLIGEHVVIVKALQNESNNDTRRYNWYYLNAYSIQNNINNNLLPGVISDAPRQNTGFLDSDITQLQVYQGDIIRQGRWGNSIRLSSTVDSATYANYKKIPTWSGSSIGTPIIILSNKKQSNDIETADTDYSSLWLTSTQTVTMTLNNTLRKTNRYESQLIGTADRIILKSKSDVVALDSKIAVEVNAPITSFGVSDRKEEMLHSTVIVEVISSMLNILSAGNIDSSGNISNPVLASKLSELQTKLLGKAYNKKMLQDKDS